MADEPKEKTPQERLSKENLSILTISRSFQDLTATPAWKDYERILLAQIGDRVRLIETPLHSWPDPNVPYEVRIAQMESLKGAIIGLRLALGIPSATMKHAQDILREVATPEKPQG